VESLSTYAKQFLERMEKPDVDRVEGISPAVAIEQRNPTKTSRSTVGTATEVYDYLRLLWARVGRTYCPGTRVSRAGARCGRTPCRAPPTPCSRSPEGTRVMVCFPLPLSARVTHALVVENLRALGFLRVLARRREMHLDELPEGADLTRRRRAARGGGSAPGGRRRSGQRLADSLQTAFRRARARRWWFRSTYRGCASPSASAARAPGDRLRDARPRSSSPSTTRTAPARSAPGSARCCVRPGADRAEPARSLAEGAVDPWSKPRYETRRRSSRSSRRKQGVSWTRPGRAPGGLPRAVLHGTRGFEGVLPFLTALEEKRYKQYIRVFLRQYQSAQDCPTCGGAKLRPEALRVRSRG
jgi:excinuclease ABC subunit A